MGGFEQAANAKANNTMPIISPDYIVNLDHGDPTVFEPYWKRVGEKCSVQIRGGESMSYFSDVRNVCWFLEPQLRDQIKRVHRVVGNAEASNGQYLVVGNGSTQLYQAALYALTAPGGGEPVSVISAAPYYSAYEEATDILKSGLFKWAGDAYSYEGEGPYVELVTSPNNPDGQIREAVVKTGRGKVIHDLAYYWPQYTPICRPADHDVMLFTFSKGTGFAGSRIGWAIVKDKEVATKMTKFIEVCSIGVSKEAQIRAAKILEFISDSCQDSGISREERFFEHAKLMMNARWEKLREVVKSNTCFTLPKYSDEYCNFYGKFSSTDPAFAWLKCKEEVDCANLLKACKLITRNGKRCGSTWQYARISMTGRDADFNLFLERLKGIKLCKVIP